MRDYILACGLYSGDWVEEPTSWTLDCDTKATIPIRICTNGTYSYNDFVDVVIKRGKLTYSSRHLNITYMLRSADEG